MVESHLSEVPRYRQRVDFVPFGIARPVWVDDADFNVGYHVRRTALPRPGGSAELRALVGRLMSQRLDRTKPLWEIWLVEGLPDDQWAMLSKVHHCMVDGVSGAEILSSSSRPTPRSNRSKLPIGHLSPARRSTELLIDAGPRAV